MQKIPPTETPLATERSLAKKIGLAPATLQGLRTNVLAPDDWEETAVAVVYRESGVAKMLAFLHVAPGELAEAGAAKPPHALLTVVRRHRFNPALVLAALPHDREKTVVVRVRDSRMWLPGAQINALPPAEGSVVWRLYGRQPNRPVRPPRPTSTNGEGAHS